MSLRMRTQSNTGGSPEIRHRCNVPLERIEIDAQHWRIELLTRIALSDERSMKFAIHGVAYLYESDVEYRVPSRNGPSFAGMQ